MLLIRCLYRRSHTCFQCALPCFEGLLPPVHDKTISSLLYVLAYWHGLAKMRIHTESSLTTLDHATTVLGAELRYFEGMTCPEFTTHETSSEAAARARALARQNSQRGGGPTAISVQSGRRERKFNLRTVKTHFLGDYVPTIRHMGTTDSYNTQIVRIPSQEHYQRAESMSSSIGRAGTSPGESSIPTYKQATSDRAACQAGYHPFRA